MWRDLSRSKSQIRTGMELTMQRSEVVIRLFQAEKRHAPCVVVSIVVTNDLQISEISTTRFIKGRLCIDWSSSFPFRNSSWRNSFLNGLCYSHSRKKDQEYWGHLSCLLKLLLWCGLSHVCFCCFGPSWKSMGQGCMDLPLGTWKATQQWAGMHSFYRERGGVKF